MNKLILEQGVTCAAGELSHRIHPPAHEMLLGSSHPLWLSKHTLGPLFQAECLRGTQTRTAHSIWPQGCVNCIHVAVCVLLSWIQLDK